MSLKITALDTLAGGLNIEGGLPCRKLESENDGPTIWSNVILVLDRPLIDDIVFDEIFKDTTYPLLENRIEEINEHHFLAAYLMILQYYINNGKEILEKDTVNIIVHVHQNVQSIVLIDIMRDLLIGLNGELDEVNIRWVTDTPDFTTTNHSYKNIDILISLSQCAGLDLEYPPGCLLVSDTFIPYNIDTNTINLGETYTVENDLIDRLNDILLSEYNQLSVNYINAKYESFNPKKTFRASRLEMKDFKRTSILQVDKLWNPTNKEELVALI